MTGRLVCAMCGLCLAPTYVSLARQYMVVAVLLPIMTVPPPPRCRCLFLRMPVPVALRSVALAMLMAAICFCRFSAPRFHTPPLSFVIQRRARASRHVTIPCTVGFAQTLVIRDTGCMKL